MDIAIIALAVSILAIVLGLAAWYRADRAGVEPEVETELLANPGGCTVNGHEWRKRWTLESGHEHVYYCKKGCGSSLRHRFE